VKFSPTDIPGVVIVDPEVYRDERGYFLETFHSAKYASGGLSGPFLQDNHSSSVRNTLRGLHMQLRKPQGKLVRAIEGEVWDVAVDMRPDSPTFGRWTAQYLSAENFRQLYVPAGCAHGFCVLSERAQVEYKCTALYDPADEVGIAYDDPTINIPWPVKVPILSAKDSRNLLFVEILDRLPREKEIQRTPAVSVAVAP
jgi:dTDP-4-dehydrorhamnose 3,5-epimerase